MIVKAGSTDVTTYFVLRTAADGTATTGATITNIDLQYCRSGAAPSAKVDATALAATDSAHADNKAIEIDGTDAPGLYRVDWPDAAFAAGVREVILTVKLASSFTEHLRVELSPPVDVQAVDGDETAAANLKSACDNYSAARGLTGTALPAAAADAAGGVPVSDAGGLDLDTKLANTNEVTAARMGALTDWIDGGRLDLLIDAIKAETDKLVLVAAEAPSTWAHSSIADQICNKDSNRTFSAATHSLEAIRSRLDATYSRIGAAGAGLTAVPWNASWDAEVQSEVTDALNAYDPPTNAEMEARTLLTASYFDPANDTVVLADGAHGGSSATITLSKLTISADDAAGAVDIDNSGGAGMNIQGSTDGMYVAGVSRDIHGNITGSVSGSVGSVTGHTPQTGDNYARLGAPAGASVSADIAAVKTDTGNTVTDTNELQTDWTDGGRLDLLIDVIKAKTDNLPSGIPKNVALSNFEWLMVDSTDHITPKTGLTVTAQISKDGGAFANSTNSAAEISAGVYKIDWTQTEMNADIVCFKFTATGADQTTIVIKTDA